MAYNTFTGRSKAGRGKTPWGITPSMQKRLVEARHLSESSPETHLKNLFRFTEIYVSHARNLAKSGQKDSARNWYRFFNNSQILPLLAFSMPSADLVRLREDLNFLGLECHPLDVPSFETDLESINHCLKEILAHVVKNSPKTKNIANRPRLSRIGHRQNGSI